MSEMSDRKARKVLIEEAISAVLVMSGSAALIIIVAVLLAGCWLAVSDSDKTPPPPTSCEAPKTVVLDGSRTGTKGRQETASIATVVQTPECGKVGIVIKEPR